MECVATLRGIRKGGHGGEPFSEDAVRTGAIAAKSLAHAHLEAHPILGPGQVRQGAPISGLQKVLSQIIG